MEVQKLHIQYVKINIVLILLILRVSLVFGQDEIPAEYPLHRSLNLNIGYNYSFGEPNDKNFHLLDIGFNKTVFGGRHGAGFEYGISNEIGLNTDKFTIGPKVRGIAYYQFIVLGLELVSYTDFDNGNLRLVPMLGFGSNKFRVTINPQVSVVNDDFQPIDNGLINFTFNLSLKNYEVGN